MTEGKDESKDKKIAERKSSASKGSVEQPIPQIKSGVKLSNINVNQTIPDFKLFANDSYSINSLAEIFEKFKSEIVDSSKIKSKLPKNENISRKQALNNIASAYKDETLCLVLGAGISLEFGVPNWNKLLQNLMVHTIENVHEISSILSKLFNSIFTPNPLIAGRYLQDYFEESNTSFESAVREVLYSSINKNKSSELLNEITRLCVAPGKSPNLNSIITYNFDDILEHYLDKTEMDIPYKSIYGIGMDVGNAELPIYHVHGFLPEHGGLNDAHKITFGENNYHQQYSDIYSWNNIVQINKFRETTCLFIGSSLTDPNIRRLLDIALKQKGNKRKHHYVFKKKIDDKRLIADLKAQLQLSEILDEKNNSGLHFDETVTLIREIYERFEENDSASFGVKTIWVKSWEEIPLILKTMREGA